jgi:hypothetical protein
MIISRLEEFSDDQAITADAAATNVWDGIAAGGAIGEEQWFVVKTGSEVFNTLTSLDVKLVTDDALPIDASSTVLLEKNFLLAEIDSINTPLLKVRIPRNQKRYVGVYYDVQGTDPTTGKITAFLTENLQDQDLLY